MSLQVVNHICEANDIQLHIGSYGLSKFYKDEAYRKDNACAILHQRGHTINKLIIIGLERQEKEIVAWHELGHHMHELGQIPNSYIDTLTHHPIILTRELAANDWVFQNYVGNYSLGKVCNRLRKSIMTYINSGDVAAYKIDCLERSARALNIYDKIVWVKPEEALL